MTLVGVISQLMAGLTRGSILFLLASGLSLVFGVNKVINFTHGSLYLIGMYVSFSVVNKVLVGLSFNFWLGLVLAPLCIAAIAALMEIFLFRRIYESEHLMQLVLAFGLVYIMNDIIRFAWGVVPLTVDRPRFLSGALRVAGGLVPTYSLLIIAVGVIVGIVLWIVIQKTNFGRLMRASAADPHMTRALGVRVPSVLTAVFSIGGFLAGFAGALNLPLGSATLGIDAEATNIAFIVVIIGGTGSIIGTAAAALCVGLVESFGIMLLPQYTIVWVYLLMVVVLLVRPYGLFGKKVV